MAAKAATVQGVSGSIAASSTKTLATLTAGASQLVRVIRLRVTQDAIQQLTANSHQPPTTNH